MKKLRVIGLAIVLAITFAAEGRSYESCSVVEGSACTREGSGKRCHSGGQCWVCICYGGYYSCGDSCSY
jgi:hypothetical protein